MNNSWMTVPVRDIGAFDHIALIVENLDSEADVYRQVYFAKVSTKEHNDRYGLSSAFVDLGYTKLRLLQPDDRNAPVVGLVEPHGWAGVHHVCYRVDDIETTRERLRGEGYRPLSGDEYKLTPAGRRTIFLRPPEGTGPLVKLEEQ